MEHKMWREWAVEWSQMSQNQFSAVPSSIWLFLCRMTDMISFRYLHTMYSITAYRRVWRKRLTLIEVLLQQVKILWTWQCLILVYFWTNFVLYVSKIHTSQVICYTKTSHSRAIHFLWKVRSYHSRLVMRVTLSSTVCTMHHFFELLYTVQLCVQPLAESGHPNTCA